MTVDLGYLYFWDEVLCEYPKQNQIRCKTKELVAICAVESYPCRAIVPPVGDCHERLRWNPKFRSTKGSGFPPSTPKLGRKIYVLPLWFEVICLSTPENLQQTRKLGNKSENQWLSIMFPLAKIAMNLNVIPPWRGKDTLQRELSWNGKFQCMIYPDENYPTNSMVSHGGQAPKPGAWEVLLG